MILFFGCVSAWQVRSTFCLPPIPVLLLSYFLFFCPLSESVSPSPLQTYSMDCYFRQSWVDKRLAFEGAQDTLALSVSMLARIWKPDTYFYNGKQSYLHTITTPNKFVRIYQNGRVLYSSRLTIKAGCPMNLADFPMDIQKCPLKFGSCEYAAPKGCQVACATQWLSGLVVIIMHNCRSLLIALWYDFIFSARQNVRGQRQGPRRDRGGNGAECHDIGWDFEELCFELKGEMGETKKWHKSRKCESGFHASEWWKRIRWSKGLMGCPKAVWYPSESIQVVVNELNMAKI